MKKKKDEITIRSSAAEYLTYVASVGNQQDSIEMRYEDENIWLTQKMMATLYDVGTNTINYHIKKIFEDSELQKDSVIRNFEYCRRRKKLQHWAEHLDRILTMSGEQLLDCLNSIKKLEKKTDKNSEIIIGISGLVFLGLFVRLVSSEKPCGKLGFIIWKYIYFWV